MTQTFMDGGGRDGGGAAFQGPGNDAPSFDAGADMGGPSNTAVWNPGLKGVKLSDMVQGINVTPNFMLAMLFLGFTAWLFVIYWIRHNEPLANQVLGTPAALAPTGSADRAIVDGVRNALPIRTSNSFANFYTPDRKQRSQQESGAGEAYSYTGAYNQADNRIERNFGDAYPVASGQTMLGPSHARIDKQGREHVVVPTPGAVYVPEAGVVNYHAPDAPTGMAPATPSHHGMKISNSHYHVGVHTADGPKLRTVVNR